MRIFAAGKNSWGRRRPRLRIEIAARVVSPLRGSGNRESRSPRLRVGLWLYRVFDAWTYFIFCRRQKNQNAETWTSPPPILPTAKKSTIRFSRVCLHGFGVAIFGAGRKIRVERHRDVAKKKPPRRRNAQAVPAKFHESVGGERF